VLALFGERHHGCLGPNMERTNRICKQIYWFAYKNWQRRRLSMKPGITCIWQVSGRSNVSFEKWMKMDMEYIDNWSLVLDIKILLKTIWVVLYGKGAY